MSNIQKFGAWTTESAAKEKEELSRIGGSQFYKWKNGENTLRFLPPPVGRDSPFVTVFQHFIRVPGLPKSITFNCGRLMAKKPCPACRRAEELRATGNQADYELAKQFLAKPRTFANAVDRENPESGPQVVGMGKNLYDQLLGIRNSRTGGNFTDPGADGFDIIVTKTGTKVEDTRYTALPDRQGSELGNLEWIEVQQNLDRFTSIPTPEAVAEMFSGVGPSPAGTITTSGVSSSPKRLKRTAEDDLEDIDS